jgi:hypothetical protein
VGATGELFIYVNDAVLALSGLTAATSVKLYLL